MTDFFNFFVQGISRGSVYALVALGFVIIFKATHILNFGQGALMSWGAYFAYTFNGGVEGQFVTFKPWTLMHLPWVVSLVIGMLIAAAIGVGIERFVLRRFRGRPPFTIIMATFGIAIMSQFLIDGIWGGDPMSFNEPIGLKSYKVFGVPITLADIVTFCVAAAVTIGFLAFFKYSRLGTGMRATALDQEAALAQGISTRQIFALAWGISAALACLAAVLISTGNGRTVNQPEIALAAFAAFPAIILGGVDSIPGAIVGGLVIGISEQLMFGYQAKLSNWLGVELGTFHQVIPYVLMLAILLVRPYGLFGEKDVRRV